MKKLVLSWLLRNFFTFLALQKMHYVNVSVCVWGNKHTSQTTHVRTRTHTQYARVCCIGPSVLYVRTYVRTDTVVTRNYQIFHRIFVGILCLWYLVLS